MKSPQRLLLASMLTLGVALCSGEARAQYYEAYYPPATYYYAPAPVVVSPPVSIYQPAYYGPVTSYYAPVTGYYAPAPAVYGVPSRVQYYDSGRIKQTYYYGNGLKLKVKSHPFYGVYDVDWDD